MFLSSLTVMTSIRGDSMYRLCVSRADFPYCVVVI